jgi:P27 family predicted phage terminase small subunit
MSGKGKPKRGRPRKPSYLKVLQGTARPDRMNEQEPEPEVCIPTPPEIVASDQIANEAWRRLGRQLVAVRGITVVDWMAFESLCIEYARYCRANDAIKRTGEMKMIKTKSGYMMQNPYLSISNNAFKNWYRMAVEFGITPSSRSRVSAGEKKVGPDDDFETFLRNGKTTEK